MDINTKVNSDTSVSDYKVSMTMTNMVYNLLTKSAKESGYKSLREQFTARQMGNANFNYNEKWDKDKVTITMEANGPIQSTNQSEWKIQEINGFMVYEDSRLLRDITPTDTEENELSSAMLSSISINYYLEMPGKIVVSNANTVTENKAEWHLSGIDGFNTRFYAKSELPLLPSLPGFEAILAVFGVLGALCLIKYRR
jgi:hypothetical protein